MRFYSNGKLLLTGEYLVLDGAKSLAVPTKFGQDLVVETFDRRELIWASFDHLKQCWFEAVFELPKLRLKSASFNSKQEGGSEMIAETLQNVLLEARKLNSEFLNLDEGYLVKTNLTFPRDWGLGTSSTFINNVASWAQVDAYQLLWNAFSGSGYDIACAQNNSPIFYEKLSGRSSVHQVEFSPSFKNQLFFVYLNEKQNSRKGIQRYNEKKGAIKAELGRISDISELWLQSEDISQLEELIKEHENIVSNIIELPKVQDRLFSDYFGVVKSLGAWGGDFVLVTGNEETPLYFQRKGFETVIPYSDMVL